MASETIVKLFIPFALGLMMLAMGLGLTVADFRRVGERPWVVAAGSLAQLVGLPALGFGIAWAFGLAPELAIGLVLVSACPGGPTSNLYTALARGDVALSVTLTAVSSVATIVTLPMVVNLAGRTFAAADMAVALPVADTMLQIALVMALPLSIGMGWRHGAPQSAQRAEPWLQRLAVGLLMVLVVGAIARESARITTYAGDVGIAVLALGLSGMALGYGVARALRQPPAIGVTFAIEVGMQNAALAIGIALGLLQNDRMAIPPVVYGVLAYGFCALGIVAGRRWIPAPAPGAG
jgi:BASS family bile acid:Na+ symporter